MIRMVKWLIVAAATLAAFVLCLWAGWIVGIRLWPRALHSAADRWVVSAAFATVMGGAVLAGAGWWAGRDKTSIDHKESPPLLIQDIYAGEGGSAYGVQHGNQYLHHQPPTGSPETSVPLEGGQDDQE
jgi:hypothetical protein